MLDIEIIEGPSDTGLSVVTLDEFARHLRLSARLRTNPDWILNMTDALNEAVDKLHGLSGELNRMVLPCKVRRYLRSFPSTGRPILLPYPDVISVEAITIEDGGSPANDLPAAAYTVEKGKLIPEIHAIGSWPSVVAGPRAVSVTYRAGYREYPFRLKRLVKTLAAHALENPEATINEPRQMAVNRKVDFGVSDDRAALRIPVSYDDWM
ncbi:hypothetical protein [Shinella zoogloeoides]|uniref:hypothetical protein n=1 Tax=Shinella zoogloeoides TaxID=352475 RepID=UPI00299F2026|nr:hypothetical protein [Shinella zoogloeoides]WPE19957.1 hypothetical protein ShzoTeo12_11370 [Shinella zoogloeoides]